MTQEEHDREAAPSPAEVEAMDEGIPTDVESVATGESDREQPVGLSNSPNETDGTAPGDNSDKFQWTIDLSQEDWTPNPTEIFRQSGSNFWQRGGSTPLQRDGFDSEAWMSVMSLIGAAFEQDDRVLSFLQDYHSNNRSIYVGGCLTDSEGGKDVTAFIADDSGKVVFMTGQGGQGSTSVSEEGGGPENEG